MRSLKNLWNLRQSTLSNNIVVLLMVFGITPLALLFFIFQHVYISLEKTGVERLQKEISLRVTDHLSSYINQGLIHTKNLSERVDGNFSYQNLFLKLNDFLIQNPEYNQVTFLDSQGREVYKAAQDYTFQAFELEDRRGSLDIQQALTGKIVISPDKLSKDNRLMFLAIIFPVKDAQDRITGVFEAKMNLIPFWALISEQISGENYYAYIISPDGNLISGQDFSSLLTNPDLSTMPIVQAFIAGHTGVWNYPGLQGQQVIGASALVPANGWAVIVEKSSSAAYGQIHKVATLFLSLYAFTLMAAIILGLIFSQDRIIGPVKALQQEVDSLSQGVFPHEIIVKDNDEMGQLSQAFNQMVRHLKNTMVSRDFLAREVAERKVVEEALRRREATLRSIFLTVPLGIGSLHQWILVEGNESFYKITGYPKEEIQGRNLSQLFGHLSGYNQMVEQLRQTLANEETAVIETQWRRRDGQVREILLKFAAIDKNDGETDLVFAAMDSSDLKKMEQERLRIDKLESLGIIAGGIAHDFNNILTIIIGNIELVGLELKKSDKSLDLLLEAEQACQRAQHLAKQLLTFAKGGMPVKRTVNVEELLHNVIPLALSGSNSAIDILIDDNVWPVDIDSGQLHQVINNILINADQAMPNGGLITIKVTNQLVTPASGLPLPNGNYVKFSFIDQGIGIGEKDLGKIFDPYFTTKQFGNGLGLTTAFSIIKNHQGHISVDSKLGEGSSFHIFLPAGKTADLTVDPEVSTIPVRGQGRILVMDDEPAIRAVLGQMLHKLGYTPVCVAD